MSYNHDNLNRVLKPRAIDNARIIVPLLFFIFFFVLFSRSRPLLSASVYWYYYRTVKNLRLINIKAWRIRRCYMPSLMGESERKRQREEVLLFLSFSLPPVRSFIYHYAFIQLLTSLFSYFIVLKCYFMFSLYSCTCVYTCIHTYTHTSYTHTYHTHVLY